MTGASALYFGSVFHRRLGATPHRFRYRMFWLFVDLDELDALGRAAPPLLAQPLQSLQPARPRPRRRKRSGACGSRPVRFSPNSGLATAPAARSGSCACRARWATTSIRSASISATPRRRARGADLRGPQHLRRTPQLRACPRDLMARRCAPGVRQGLLRLAVPADGPALRVPGLAAGRDRSRSPSGRSGRTGPSCAPRSPANAGRSPTGRLLRATLAAPFVAIKTIAAIHWQAVRLSLKGAAYRGPRRRGRQSRSPPRCEPHSAAAACEPVRHRRDHRRFDLWSSPVRTRRAEHDERQPERQPRPAAGRRPSSAFALPARRPRPKPTASIAAGGAQRVDEHGQHRGGEAFRGPAARAKAAPSVGPAQGAQASARTAPAAAWPIRPWRGSQPPIRPDAPLIPARADLSSSAALGSNSTSPRRP